MKYLINVFAAAALLTYTLPSVAEEEGPPDPSDYGNWYQVEIIVFAQNEPELSGESWPVPELSYPADMLAIAPENNDDLKPQNLAQLQQLLHPATLTPDEMPPRNYDANTMPDPAGPGASMSHTTASNEPVDPRQIFDADLPRAFRLLPADQYHLGGIATSIRRSSRYRMLLHISWLQPIMADGPAWPVLIQAGNRYGDQYELDGTLTLSRARFLHVDTDLWFSTFKPRYDDGQQAPLPDVLTNLDPSTRASYPGLVAAAENGTNFVKAQTYTMTLSRRMRSSTLHYLDNPFFGVMIQVDQFNYSSPETEPSTGPTPSPAQ